ncbi:zf-HC2 domain-containing protein [Actinomycetospora sp. OC33-EN08]|uniref:Zf-HC2 domain-containing protein n=1 Tax=Actinomycetospora aurantiaca TaxID=3129233 RepID=A0ABU8MNC5_9PSEU
MTLPPDEHEALRDRLGAYALDGLDAAERDAVETHLAGCADCRAELAAVAPLAGPLGLVDPDLPAAARPGDAGPGPGGFDDVLRRIGAEDAAGPGPAPVRPLARPRPARRTGLLLAAAGLVIALAGAAAGFGLGARSAQGPVEPVAVQALAPGVEADAGTIAHTWGVEVVLTARGFDAGRTYLVAVIDRAGRPVGAGAFVGTGTAEMVCRLNSPVLPAEATGFVVTTGQGDEVLRSRFA